MFSFTLESLVRHYTAFSGMADMLNSHKSYRPSLNCISNKNIRERQDLTFIADAYDNEMSKRGDTRRAYRY